MISCVCLSFAEDEAEVSEAEAVFEAEFREESEPVSFAENQGDGLGNGFVRIKIRDEGPGVDEEELPLILEKYYRGKNTNEKQGYGLGLYLVNYYMEKQGGGMEYYNDNGFVVELHVKKV